MAFADPKKHIAYFDLDAGMHVADFGVGAGHYAIAMAKIVGDEGRVYAIDIQKELLERVKRHAREAGVNNLEVIWGDIERVGGTRLKDASIDVVLLSNILFQIEEKSILLEEMHRILHAQGKVIVIDWSESFGNMGPHADAVVQLEVAERLFTEHDFKKDKTFDAGEHHYGCIFSKKNK